jgi:hypothetical protein
MLTLMRTVAAAVVLVADSHDLDVGVDDRSGGVLAVGHLRVRCDLADPVEDGVAGGDSGPGLGLPMEVATLTDLLRAEAAWSLRGNRSGALLVGWYAASIGARRKGRTPEEASHDAVRYTEGPYGGQEGRL